MTELGENAYDWLTGDALTVAPRLLGCELVSTVGGQVTAGRIVEVEAYHGNADPASHAYKGVTPRTRPMFEGGGAVYVYFTYGMYYCVNVVTGPAGAAQALLIRALEPTQGLDVMRNRRGVARDLLLTSGPGRLTQALGIDRSQSGTRLGQDLRLALPPKPLTTDAIGRSPRIGISRAADRPWRFYILGNPYVSGPKRKG